MKTINIVNKIVATNLNLDPKLVEKINRIYWKDIRQTLTRIADESVHIKKIGTIVVSPYKTNNHIRKMINRVRKLKRSTKYTDITRERLVEEAKDKLKSLLKKRNEFAIKFYKGAAEYSKSNSVPN